MSDYISGQDTIDALRNNRMLPLGDHPAYNRAMRDGENVIRNLPSAQPEITHCAECIHWKHSAARKSYCEVFDWMSKAEDFCSFAERRTDEPDR